jgi:hypothetical protein
MEVWGLLWGPRAHFSTTGHNSVQLEITTELIAKAVVAGLLLSFQSVSQMDQKDFQDRPFQPLTHPSGLVSSTV